MWSSWWIPSVSLAWRYSSQSLVPYAPLRIVLSAATCVIEEGIRFKFDAWLNNQQHRSGKQSLYSRVKVSFRRAIRWGRKRKGIDDSFALGSAKNYTKRAERRLLLARAAFKAAEAELKAAERGMTIAR